MLKTIKKLTHELLLKRHRIIVNTTSDTRLREFFNMVRPVATSQALIRLGGAGDGGYLVPDDLEGISACFSPGVSILSDFELNLADRGIPCFLTDYSVDQAPLHHPLIHFEKKFLGLEDNDIFSRLETWMSRHAPTGNDFILQMDIEGAEYEVLFDLPEHLLEKYRILVIEFHHLDRLISAEGFLLLDLIFKKLNKYFKVVHIHPNNCAPSYVYQEFEIPPIMEFTFLRRDRITPSTSTPVFPHALDKQNIPSLPDVHLPQCWHKN
jgi:hypothetical protein